MSELAIGQWAFETSQKNETDNGSSQGTLQDYILAHLQLSQWEVDLPNPGC
jgi:hypothetical protein